MPMYEYLCNHCNKDFEKFLPMKKYKEPQNCPNCNTEGVKQLTINAGGVWDSSPLWLDDSVRAQIQDTDISRPITTRSELNKHLKDTGLQPKS